MSDDMAKEMRLLGDAKERERYRAVFPSGGIPWSLLEPHREQAEKNHGQTLESLSERGGLGPDEMLAIIEGRRWRAMDESAALAQLKSLCAVPEPQPGADEAVVVTVARLITEYAVGLGPRGLKMARALFAAGRARGIEDVLATIDGRIANMRGGPRLAEAREIRQAIADAVAKETGK